MLNSIAGVFAGIAAFWGGLFGGHPGMPPQHASSTPAGMHMGTSTEMRMHRTGSTTPTWMGSSTPMRLVPAVLGKVSSINGDTLTVVGRQPGPNYRTMASSTYTVDAANARIIKEGVGTSTVASIKTGDMVAVIGTLSGTDVDAKMIIDGLMAAMMPPSHMMPMRMGSSTSHAMPMMQGSNQQ